MRLAVIALRNAAAANINTSSVTRLSHSSLSRSVMVISLESLPKFVNDFFATVGQTFLSVLFHSGNCHVLTRMLEQSEVVRILGLQRAHQNLTCGQLP